MNNPVPTNGSRDRRGIRPLAVGVAALIVALLVSVAMLFVSSETTTAVARNASHLHWTNSMLGHVGIARAAHAQAVFFAVDEAIGVASPEATERAVQEALATATSVREGLDIPALDPDQDVSTLEALEAFVAAADTVISLVEDGQVEAAANAHRDGLEPAFASVQSALTDRQTMIEKLVDESESTAGRLSMASRLIVTLLIPITALLVYRWLVKRQVRDANVEIAARLRAEQELNRSKDEFIAALSHEFRTPLTSIVGFSELLLDGVLSDLEASRELIGLINSESVELSRMVDDLLTAARLEAQALTITKTTVSSLDAVQSVLGPWIRAGHAISVDLDPVDVTTDPLRLRQILRNLVSNAVKHGGTRVGVVGRVSGQNYHWSIIDDGPGVSDEIVDRLFQRYIHDGTKALLAGSVGLGLNIARSLAGALGGSLDYRRYGETTWFTLTLPLGVAEPAREQQKQTVGAR